MAEQGDLGALPDGFADFPRIWREQCAPALAALEAERRRAMVQMGVAGIIGGGVALTVGIWLSRASQGPFGFMALLAILIMTAAVGFAPINAVSRKAKRALLHPTLAALGFRHEEKGFDPPALDALRGFSLLPGYDGSSFEDMIAGDGFALCEAHLTKQVKTKNGSTTVTKFRGLMGFLVHPAKVTGQTVLARDMGFFNALAAPPGMKRAGLVDPGFEEAFEVWTTDQVEARYLLTPIVMERLLELEAKFHGKKLRAAFADGHLYFALESKNLFEVGSPFASFANPARMRRLIDELAAVRSLVLSLRALPAGS
jgi:hypothetical protein